MKKYVMFGHNHLFGDLVDIIHANGGLLHRVVQNIPEPSHPNRKSLQQRLENLQGTASENVEVESLEAFIPLRDEHYLIGFTGFKMSHLCKELVSMLGIHFEPLIHPTAIISPSAHISEGLIVNAGAIIASGTYLGKHVVINKGAIIGHDTLLEDYVVVQPGANIGGHVKIGYGSVIGIGGIIIEDITIERCSMVAAGAVVIKDVPMNSLVAGVPAAHKKSINT